MGYEIVTAGVKSILDTIKEVADVSTNTNLNFIQRRKIAKKVCELKADYEMAQVEDLYNRAIVNMRTDTTLYNFEKLQTSIQKAYDIINSSRNDTERQFAEIYFKKYVLPELERTLFTTDFIDQY